MCYEEFIGYQCGHRSLSVLRPCPTTTQQTNHPVCANHPVQQHNASTMCTVCERLLHSRWVLILEWEHRWLHERGACGCPVIFPNLITRPRVIGGNSTAASDQAGALGGGLVPPFITAASAATPTSAPHANPFLLAAPGPQAASSPAGHVGMSGPASVAVSGRGRGMTSRGGGGMRRITSGRGSRRGRGRGNSNITGSMALVPTAPRGASSSRASAHPNTSSWAAPTSAITAAPTATTTSAPPVYAESVVGGERHVAIRLPGLFAAEWIEDHRALHRTNPAHCRVNTNPVRPLSDETQMSPEERSLLAQCRSIEERDPAKQGEQISAAVARVGDAFSGSGPYTPQHQNHAGVSAITQSLPSEVAVIAGGPSPLPVLGLPVGAGPEGTTFEGSHMPPWCECPLRRGPRKRRNSI